MDSRTTLPREVHYADWIVQSRNAERTFSYLFFLLSGIKCCLLNDIVLCYMSVIIVGRFHYTTQT